MKTLRTISALVLALLVLMSSTSFMVGMHICMGEVQDVALFTKAESCAMEKRIPPCHRKVQKPCCQDESLVHKADSFKSVASIKQMDAPAPIILELPAVIISEVIPSAPAARIQYYNYDPPLRSCDLTVDHQAFLI